jgi:RNA polymerase sigma-70 factor (ECF subfamily)
MSMKDHRSEGSGYSEFLRLHQPKLRVVARRFSRSVADADDLVQDTLERALLHFAEVSPLPPEAQRAWLVRTLSYRFIDLCRRRGKEVVGLPKAEPMDEATFPGAHSVGPRWERVTAEDLRRAVERLPAFLSEPFQLRSSGRSYKAIAEELGASQGTVASWLFQARQQLRKLLMPVAEEREVSP